MEKIKFKDYELKPCKFIFRNGKKVFGVIWEAQPSANSNYFFASNGEFQTKKTMKSNLTGFPVSLDDLIHAELLY